MPNIELRAQPVELYKLLKFEGLAASGGEAKALIAEGHVKLNGFVETRKRKKIVAGDIVEFDSEHYTISLLGGSVVGDSDGTAVNRKTNGGSSVDNTKQSGQ